ncbi:MAG: M28 family peptidase [Candidatus Aminicenantia bacterium]
MKRAIFLLLILSLIINGKLSGDWERDELLRKIATSISEENIAQTIKKLQNFGTRNTLSRADMEHFGIGGARRWIFNEFSRIKGLKVFYDAYFLPKQGRRLVKDTELYNIVAVKEGKSKKERIIILNAHYDTISVSNNGKFNYEDWDIPAPGANDDASGISAMMEIARVLRDFETDATIYYIAFAGEEQGLVGSTIFAKKMKELSKNIEAVITMDMISNIAGGNGFVDSGRVRVFSEDPNDSPSRELARYVKKISEIIIPSMNVDLVYRADRFGRGGDHTPFVLEGFPGIRFTEAKENYSIQHTQFDTIENLSLPYCAKVARIVAVSLFSLASSPPAPVVNDKNGIPMIGRGKGYDAHLRWNFEGDLEKIYEFRVYMKDTKAPFWEKSFSAGKNLEFILNDISIDDWTFGVSSVGNNGFESLITIYRLPPRRKGEFIYKELR